jgi:hypothetical protein
MKIELILDELEHQRGHHFPRAALQAAMERREEITPHLLEILERAAEDIDAIVDDPAYMAHIYAFFLLAQFREERAYPLIVDFFSIPGRVAQDVTGDFVTEDLGRVLASVSGNDLDPMKALIENPEVNQYVRSAAMDGMITLYVEGMRAREEIVAYFRELFHSRLPREYNFIWSALVGRATDIYPEEFMDEIRQAFADDLVDEMYTDLRWVMHALDEGKETTLADLHEDNHLRFVRDTIEEMEWWAGFRPPEPSVQSASDLQWMAPESETQTDPETTQVSGPRPAPPPTKVGRNDPCPCGSGLKYKYCHGKRT